ncbi:MAG: transcription-repair coupling factor [Burkholderiales bacterium]|nr:transcription-repair coupling factor [Burkholderiales bacterium]
MITDPPQALQKRRYTHLYGSSDALALARLAQEAKPLIVFCASALDAQRLCEEIPYFAPELAVNLLPDWETLPYDSFSPHHDLISERLATLYSITRGSCDLTLIPASTALYRMAPPSYLAAYTFFLKQDEKFSLPQLRAQLTLAGYSHVTQVVAPGEYCVRGGLIDLFPMGSVLPYRIDLLDEEIESIRTFDVDTQRTIYKVKEVRLLPAREFPLDEAGRTRFRARFRETFEGDPSRSNIYKDVSNGIAPAGIEYYLPLFFEHTATIFDYLPQQATLCLHRDVAATIDAFWKDTQSRYQLLRGDRTQPLLSPVDMFLPAEEFFVAARTHARIDITAPKDEAAAAEGGIVAVELPPLAVERRAADPLMRLKQFLANTPARVLLLAESLGRRETMSQYLAEYGLAPAPCANFAEFRAGSARCMLDTAPLHSGFALAGENICVITEAELYAGTVRTTKRAEARSTSVEGMVRDLSELRIGDPVVHAQHGIGRYLGLVSLDLGEGETEFLHLEYAGQDKLYVPVAQLHLISRYSGMAPDQAPLHKLGSGDWDRAKRKAAQQIRDTAAELLNLYARRAARKGHQFEIKQHDLDAFAEGFGFEETADQAAAIRSVVEDMCSGKPMDRLICGDVGFGKTEVALRAAFVAVCGGKQVAILTPTTLLAEQHFQTFSDRFAQIADEWPIKIAQLSRFRTAKEQTQNVKALADGSVDIAIGTHKLLQRDIKFHRLGLVIIDEEHRFGVRQKEALKALRAEVDVLTLTATPIPRTLAMSLEGLREFSVIATAPQKRLAIKTFVSRESQGVIREAVLRELKRGGQIYFLHNDVQTIENMHAKLAKLLPEARIVVAHGQMRERELERAMREFHQQRYNLLLCTTIIETGIDIPTANTMLINRADKFGLAQLHQLRGRVGRSHHQAYAYLLTHGEETLSAQAKKRLEAIQMMDELGSGFFLSMHDLEIRGAGEVLGESQSGEMQEIGFNLYADMLNHAVRSLRAGREPDLSSPLAITTEINLHMPALLPNDYCSDVHERLTLYKRLANCETAGELDTMQEELIDRFGLAPEPAQALLESHRLRIAARPLGVARIDAGGDAIALQFIDKPPLDGARVMQLLQRQRHWKLSGPSKLRVQTPSEGLAPRVQTVKDLLKTLRGAMQPADNGASVAAAGKA